MNRAPILPTEPPPAGPVTREAEAWGRVRALTDRALLAARIAHLADRLDSPEIVREVEAFIAVTGARLVLATSHARRLANAGGAL